MGNTKRRLNETENRKTKEKIHKIGFLSRDVRFIQYSNISVIHHIKRNDMIISINAFEKAFDKI